MKQMAQQKLMQNVGGVRCTRIPTQRNIVCAGVDRRAVLAATVLAANMAQIQPSFADTIVFNGKATPASSYGGYGGATDNEPDRYEFNYPSEWKLVVPSKVEKGSQGIDGKVINPKAKGQKVLVKTFGRDGEDNAQFKLTDMDSTLRGFTATDPEISFAFETAESTEQKQIEVDGKKYYRYNLDGPDTHIGASVTVSSGKIFAMFVETPDRYYAKTKQTTEEILDSFRVFDI